jgi:hypothetical protein
MAFTYKILAQGQSTSAAMTTFNTILTVGSGKSLIINKIELTNTTGNGTGAVLRIVPSGATPGNTHNYGPSGTGASVVVAAYSTRTYNGPITLSAGDVIQISTETANVINYHIFGVEIS